jgi:hypothetical protein
MNAYWGSGGIASHILISELDGGEWSASRPGRFTPIKRGLAPTEIYGNKRECIRVGESYIMRSS